MHGTGKWNGESIFAWAIVIALHALLWRELSRIDLPRIGHTESSARLRLTWIPRQSPRHIDRPKAIAQPRAAQAGSDAGDVRSDEASQLPRETVHSAPQPTRSLSAVFLEQGRRHAEQLVQAERLPMDPFASRNGGFQRPAPNTIRMKPQISPQDVVAAVGQYLFAPPGYEQDPCPQNARNIQKLLDGSDPKSMQYELEYEREYCRP